jgi:cobalamin biosynthesis Mg chelatase CobN
MFYGARALAVREKLATSSQRRRNSISTAFQQHTTSDSTASRRHRNSISTASQEHTASDATASQRHPNSIETVFQQHTACESTASPKPHTKPCAQAALLLLVLLLLLLLLLPLLLLPRRRLMPWGSPGRIVKCMSRRLLWRSSRSGGLCIR